MSPVRWGRGVTSSPPNFGPSGIHNVEPGQSDFVVFLGDVEDIWVHYFGVTNPCAGDHTCPHCPHDPKPPRYQGYAPVLLHSGSRDDDGEPIWQRTVLSVTSGLSKQLHPDGFPKVSLRARKYRLYREVRGNSPAMRLMREYLGRVPEVGLEPWFDVKPFVERLWDKSIELPTFLAPPLPPGRPTKPTKQQREPDAPPPSPEQLDEMRRRFGSNRKPEPERASPSTHTPPPRKGIDPEMVGGIDRSEARKRVDEYVASRDAAAGQPKPDIGEFERKQAEALDRKRRGLPVRDAEDAVLSGRIMDYVANGTEGGVS